MSANDDKRDREASIADDLPDELADSARAVADSAGIELNTESARSKTETETQQADGFAIDVYEVRQNGPEGPAGDGALLGLAADMPVGAVYVDWDQTQWPEDEQLSGPHVSEYASVEDLEQATGNAVTHVDTVGGGAEGGSETDQQAAEDVTAQDLAEFVASHWDGADAADVLDALDEVGEFGGAVDLRELASLVADAADESTGDVLNFMESEGETLTLAGLSREAREFVTERYNVDVVGAEE